MAEQIDHGFDVIKSADGEELEFNIKGAGLGGGAIAAFVFFAIVFSLLGGVFATGMSGTAGNFFGAVTVFLLISIGAIVLLQKAKSEISTFKIKKEFFGVNGREYAKNDISEIFVRGADGNAAAQVQYNGGSVLIGTGVVGAALAMGNAVNQVSSAVAAAAKDSMDARKNAVCIRHGRTVVPLAKNLLIDDAISLFNKVTEVA